MMMQFNTAVIFAISGLILSVLAHAWASIWWASRITSKVESVDSNLSRLDKELEKRDTQISAIWKRIDEIRDMINGK